MLHVINVYLWTYHISPFLYISRLFYKEVLFNATETCEMRKLICR